MAAIYFLTMKKPNDVVDDVMDVCHCVGTWRNAILHRTMAMSIEIIHIKGSWGLCQANPASTTEDDT